MEWKRDAVQVDGGGGLSQIFAQPSFLRSHILVVVKFCGGRKDDVDVAHILVVWKICVL